MIRTISRSIGCALVLLVVSCFGVQSGRAQVDVLTYHNDNSRTGANLQESILTPASVSQQTFGMLFKRVVDDQVYGQPLVATNVLVHGGRHDIVIVTTVKNSVYAFDANDAAATAPLWHINYGAPINVSDGDWTCTDINGDMGIIGTPVMDEAKSALYVVANTRVGNVFEQRLHAIDPATGADLPHSPVSIEAPQFDPVHQNQRPALFLANHNVYVGYASHCDVGNYHGFLFGFDQTTLEPTGVFNTTPNGGNGGSIWQTGQAPVVDDQGNILFITSNGSWNGVDQFSDSVLKLDPNLHLLDWFTPTNFASIDAQDLDFNSGGPLLIPGTHMLVGGGKQGVLYTFNTEALGHVGDEHAVQHFQATSSHLHSLVFWKSDRRGSLLYLWGQQDKLRAYRLDGTLFREKPVMMRHEHNDGHPGAMLSISANGTRDGILWAAIHATGDSIHESRPVALHAFDAGDLSHELWNSLRTPARDNCGNYSKMAPPTIANGKVYLASFGTENIGTGQLCVYGLLPDGPVPAAPGDLHAELHNRSVTLTWEPVAGAETYSVTRKRSGEVSVVASGLTQPEFTEAAADDRTEYTVTANNRNGSSEHSPETVITAVESDPQH